MWCSYCTRSAIAARGSTFQVSDGLRITDCTTVGRIVVLQRVSVNEPFNARRTALSHWAPPKVLTFSCFGWPAGGVARATWCRSRDGLNVSTVAAMDANGVLASLEAERPQVFSQLLLLHIYVRLIRRGLLCDVGRSSVDWSNIFDSSGFRWTESRRSGLSTPGWSSRGTFGLGDLWSGGKGGCQNHASHTKQMLDR